MVSLISADVVDSIRICRWGFAAQSGCCGAAESRQYGDAWMSVFRGITIFPTCNRDDRWGMGPVGQYSDYLAEGGSEITEQRTIEDMTFALGFVLTQLVFLCCIMAMKLDWRGMETPTAAA